MKDLLDLNRLPKAEILELDLFIPYNNDELEDLILDFLSGKYGVCINSFNYKINNDFTHVLVSNINWATELIK